MNDKILKFIPEFFLQNKHLNTIYPSLFRKVELNFTREFIVTKDQDFFHIDRIKNGSKNLIILCHGFEGSSSSTYIKGLSYFLSSRNCDIIVINNRGCCGNLNLTSNFSHYGFTSDLKLIIQNLHKEYTNIGLVGFSMGGNMVLKYLGENEFIPKTLKASVVIAPVLDLKSTLKNIDSLKNYIYKQRFLSSIKKKTIKKYQENSYLFYKDFDIEYFKKIKSFYEYDKYINLPYSGHFDLESFYRENSSLFYLEKISIPTHIISANDDPLITFPIDVLNKIISQNKNLTFELSEKGGHVGFLKKDNEIYWHESKIYEFLGSKINF